MAANLTEAQERKLRDVPRHLRGMYREAVGGDRRAALRFHCLECVAWVHAEVEACTAPGCVLYPYRLTGVHPAESERRAAVAHAAGLKGPPRAGHMTGDSARESPISSPDGSTYEPAPDRPKSGPRVTVVVKGGPGAHTGAGLASRSPQGDHPTRDEDLDGGRARPAEDEA